MAIKMPVSRVVSPRVPEEVHRRPKRHGPLKGVDGKAASVKGGCPVRGADGDKHAGFADCEAAKAVDDGHTVDAVLFVKLSSDFAHLGEGHGLVRFIIEVKRAAIMRLIADEAVEGDDGAVLRRAQVNDERAGVDRLANQLEDVIMNGRGHGFASATTDGWKESDFVARIDHRIPSRKFLVARGHDGRAIFGKLRKVAGIPGEKLLDGGGIGKVQRFLGVPDDIFQASEKQDLDAYALRDSGHTGIVAHGEAPRVFFSSASRG